MRQGILFCGACLSALLSAVPVGAGAAANLTLSDDRNGVTCAYVVRGTRLSWQRQGGDWIDVRGTAYGESAYAVAAVGPARGRQQIAFDVTGLVSDWLTGRVPAGLVFLRVPEGAGRGAVNFNSREAADALARPRLEVDWRDGRHSVYDASADSHLPCSTSKSVGQSRILQLKDGTNVVMRFQLDPAQGHGGVAAARLVLTADKVYRQGTSVAVHAVGVQRAQDVPVESGLASGYVRDEGIAADSSVVYASSFESDTWTDGWTRLGSNSNVARVARDPGNRFEPLVGEALRVTVKQGKVQGVNTQFRFADNLGEEPQEMYFRYYLRLGENWNPKLEGGKLPGFAGTYNRAGWGGRRANGVNGWSARGAFFRWRDQISPMGALRGIGSYVYFADMPATYGSLWGWNEGPTGMLEKNRWYAVEQHVRLNTPGRADGLLQAWIDGRLAFEKQDIRFRDIPDLRIESLWLNVYHGGTTPADEDLSLYIDNLVIARRYIGPMTR